MDRAVPDVAASSGVGVTVLASSLSGQVDEVDTSAVPVVASAVDPTIVCASRVDAQNVPFLHRIFGHPYSGCWQA